MEKILNVAEIIPLDLWSANIRDLLMDIQLKDIDTIEPDEIDDQIKVRRHLIDHELVGTLYPAILEDQIEKLQAMKGN